MVVYEYSKYHKDSMRMIMFGKHWTKKNGIVSIKEKPRKIKFVSATPLLPKEKGTTAH